MPAVLAEALETDGIQVTVNIGIDRSRIDWILLHYLEQGINGGRRRKGRASCQATVQHTAERPNIGPFINIDQLATGLFRRHVTGGSNDLPSRR